MNTTERERIVDILRFWFGEWDERVPLPEGSSVMSRWFGGKKDFDEECQVRCEPDVVRAATEHYSRWMETADGSIALVLLLDQLPRNIYRGTPRAFAQDVMAQKVARHAIEYGIDRQMTLPQRMFLVLPFTHAEELEAHDAAIAHNESLIEDARAAGSAHVALYEKALDFEHRHRKIIERFGRYPHRNAVLGRASTPEEVEFLKQPGSSF